jgi:hypothetical protein
VVTDPGLLGELAGGRTLLGAYLETVDRSQFVLYRVRPTRVRYMKEWAAEYTEVPLAPAASTA